MTDHQVFPDNPATFSYTSRGTQLISGAGREIQFFYDEACTQVANIVLASTNVPIFNARVTVGLDSMLPDFYEQTDSVDVLWGRAVSGGQAYPVQVRMSDRIAALEELVDQLATPFVDNGDGTFSVVSDIDGETITTDNADGTLTF